ncbi:Uncharacterised protein [Actinobacillus indolicus]|nr:Uncharacterised protein [Actinobacillus indolicus]VTU08530.1 Uncharacterised protein [Actinobacillus indolicus]
MKQQPEVFISAINGIKFDVQNPLTASLLSKNEKKEIIHKVKTEVPKTGKGKKDKLAEVSDDNEQEIS